MPDLSLLPATAVIDGPDLLIGGCSMADVAAEFGTPAFVIDEAGGVARPRGGPPRAGGAARLTGRR
jgi:hypothetical protein